MKKNKSKVRNLGIGIFLFILIILFSVLFVKQYKKLGTTIENERITYVSEIKEQLVNNINAEKKQQMMLVEMYAQTLHALRPEEFQDAKDILNKYSALLKESGDQIFLVDESGNIYNLDGETKSISESAMIQQMIFDKADVFSYAQINMNEEYWIYGRPMECIEIGGKFICGIMNARSTVNTGNSMSTSIFNDKGYAYITSKLGNILLYPAVKNDMGYNFFSTLERLGAPQNEIIQMKEYFDKGLEGQKFLSYGGNKWLIDYSSSIYDDWVVVVLMPMTVTAADTYRMMRSTLMAVLFWMGSIVLFLVYVFGRLYMQEQERRRASKEGRLKLEMTQKIADSKTQFLAKMSHDIRTPLNAIIGLLQITSDIAKGQTEIETNIKKAEGSADYLLSILNDILDMSKIESGKLLLNLKPINIMSVLESLVNIIEKQVQDKNIRLTLEEDGDFAEAYIGDQLRISQILMNLLSNAVKFTPSCGCISLKAVSFREDENHDKIIFAVSDTGVGMSEEYRKRLFQPFEQEDASVALNYGGSGLGLSIVKNLVELMDGEIKVESEKGKGSSFQVTVILEKTTRAVEDEDADIYTDGNEDLKGKKVLLVEDNELNAEIAYELLTRNLGVAVDIAENGQCAFDQFTGSEPGTYDVILMDIRMPVMNGLDATRHIRSSGHKQADTIPIIAMSANAYEEDIALSLEAGMNAHLSKPIDITKIRVILKKYICSKGCEG